MQDSSPDTLQWALALAASRDANGISEAHGLITGLVAGQPDLDLVGLSQHWQALNADALPDSDDPAQPLATIEPHLKAALETIQEALRSVEMTFDALIPSTERSLAERTEGLAHWCGGFLAGFGVSGGAIQDPEAQDALNLLAEIARASAEDPDATDAPEAEENALMEVLEFVKVAVLLLHEDRRGQSISANDERSEHTH